MNRKLLHGLIVLNLTLLMAFGWLSFSPDPAEAQGLGGGAGNYLMVGGKRNGVTPATIYVVDLNSGVMLGIEPRQRGRTGELVPTGFRLISNDFNAAQGR